jgi:NAD(P)H-hydrate epimerase
MKPLLTRRQAADHDRQAIANGVPGIVLMENAARGAADAIVAHWPEGVWARPLVLGGHGLNGGDGWAVARHLHARGATVCALLCGEPERILGDARINFDAAMGLGIAVAPVPLDDASLDELLGASSVVVDALFGTGLGRPLSGTALRLVERVNASEKPVVALDLPSGIDSDTGARLGDAIRADLTVTFGAAKRGLHQHPGVSHAGRVVIAGLGVPSPSSTTFTIDTSDLVRPTRPHDAHKGNAGRVLVIAGSPGKTGAALLAGMGALRTGAGLVTLAARGAARAALDAKVVELMTAEIPEALEAGISTTIREAATRDAAVLGPGVGTEGVAHTFLTRVALELEIPTVLDADALTAFASAPGALVGCRGPRVLTPHPGEAAALLGLDSASVQADRYGAASRLANLAGHVVVLKGARTIIASPDGRLAVCVEGTPALATGGTGDVLSGIIAALLVHWDPFQAACQGVLLHALAGVHAARGDRGLLAHEVADAVPSVLATAADS